MNCSPIISLLLCSDCFRFNYLKLLYVFLLCLVLLVSSFNPKLRKFFLFFFAVLGFELGLMSARRLELYHLPTNFFFFYVSSICLFAYLFIYCAGN
jgi:hypothetical protein